MRKTARKKKNRSKNGKPRSPSPPSKEEPQETGISAHVNPCPDCNDPDRMAFTPAGDQVPINPAPMQFILPDGHILALFVPHQNSCG